MLSKMVVIWLSTPFWYVSVALSPNTMSSPEPVRTRSLPEPARITFPPLPSVIVLLPPIVGSTLKTRPSGWTMASFRSPGPPCPSTTPACASVEAPYSTSPRWQDDVAAAATGDGVVALAAEDHKRDRR